MLRSFHSHDVPSQQFLDDRVERLHFPKEWPAFSANNLWLHYEIYDAAWRYRMHPDYALYLWTERLWSDVGWSALFHFRNGRQGTTDPILASLSMAQQLSSHLTKPKASTAADNWLWALHKNQTMTPAAFLRLLRALWVRTIPIHTVSYFTDKDKDLYITTATNVYHLKIDKDTLKLHAKHLMKQDAASESLLTLKENNNLSVPRGTNASSSPEPYPYEDAKRASKVPDA